MSGTPRTSACFQLAIGLLLVQSAVVFAWVPRSRINLNDNGYTGILVAIGEGVPEDSRLIQRIKDVFNDGSTRLYEASRRRASFRDVTILVPMSWSAQAAYQQATTETFDKANVIVDSPSEEYADNPYVKQFEGCGKGGEFMHVTPQFLLDNATSSTRFGDLGKLIVHEWGHLRWGLFDEYPRPGLDNNFYQSAITREVEATRCSLAITGVRKDKAGRACKISGSTSLPEPGCRFVPTVDVDEPDLKAASYMYYNSLKSVTEFCDNDKSHPEHFHNAEAPNLQNKLCGGKSSWEVMRAHEDFKDGRNPPRSSGGSSLPAAVNYKVVRRPAYTAVVVMDISGSMLTDNRHVKLNTAVRNYILNNVPKESQIGLVEFNNLARSLTTALRGVNSEQDRTSLASLVPVTANGGTSIGSGLQEAIKLLTAGGRNAKGSFIIVVSDGEENSAPTVATVLPSVLQLGVIVDGVLFDKNADRSLISLAAQTGGLSYYYSGDEGSMGLLDAFKSMVTTREGNTAGTPVSVASQALQVPSGSQACVTAIVDKSLRRDTKIILSWASNYAFRATISSQSKNFSTTVTASSTTNSFSATVLVPGLAEVGRWSVCISNLQNSVISVGIQVEAKATSTSATGREAPITLAARASDASAQFSGKDVKPLAIYATVSRGYSPVVNATVKATVEGPMRGVAKHVLVLLDDGAGADITKDDGTYSAYYTYPSAIGDHTLQVQVEGDEASKVKMSIAASQAPMIDEIDDAPETVLEDTGPFQRVAPGGFFTVASLPTPKQDLFPPSRIIDLRVTAASYEEQLVEIQFTAVGDDLDKGQAASYEIHYASSFDNILYYFENATRVDQKDVINGSVVAPGEPHSLETISFRVVPGDLIIIAVRAVDKAGNKGPLSNVVSARPSYVSQSVLPSEDTSTWILSCGPDSLHVAIPNNSSEDAYYFFGTKCSFAFNGSAHVINATLKDCGLKASRGDDHVTYTGLVVRAAADAVIQDDELELVSVKCTYSTKAINSSAASFSAAAAAGEAASGSGSAPVRGRSETNVTSVTLLQYADDRFLSAYPESSYPLPVQLGSTLYFQLKAVGRVDGVELSVEGCRAFGSHGKQHVLVRDGCVSSKSFQMLPSPVGSEKRFALKSFTLVGSDGAVYLECSTKVCDRAVGQCGVGAGGCQATTASSPSRSKRQAEGDKELGWVLVGAKVGPIKAVTLGRPAP